MYKHNDILNTGLVISNMHQARLCRANFGSKKLLDLVPKQFRFLSKIQNIGTIAFIINLHKMQFPKIKIWPPIDLGKHQKNICQGIFTLN